MAELTKEKFRPVDRSRFDSDAIVRPTVTYWQDAWRRLRKNPIAVFSMILLLACVLFITLGPTISGEEYVSINAVMKNKPADGTHWFGTDILGRDLFSRVCVGARASLIVAIACTFIQIVVGCAYGGIMAYFGGWLDEVMMRIVEILTFSSAHTADHDGAWTEYGSASCCHVPYFLVRHSQTNAWYDHAAQRI